MTEHPIIFSPAMVRAIMDGRKTQTRRVVKPQPILVNDRTWTWPSDGIQSKVSWAKNLTGKTISIIPDEYCPYGVPGDWLWVREAFGLVWPDDCDNGMIYDDPGGYGRPIRPDECKIEYRASADGDDRPGGWPNETGAPQWKPSIHMPRWASRLTLELTTVRVERLQEISPYDATAEGVLAIETPQIPDMTRINMFRGLWDSLNGKTHPWDSNPWVWVLTFRKVT